MKADCKRCFYYIHLTGRKPFCYKTLSYNPKPCQLFKKAECSLCEYGKDKEKCEFKNKPFPKSKYCTNFKRYSCWIENE